MEVKVHGKAGYTPAQAPEGSVGYDLYAPYDIYLPHGCRKMVDTGVVVQTPDELFMLFVPRSSTGTKVAKSVRIANTIGIIDPKYRGQNDTLKVSFERESKKQEYVGTLNFEPSTVNGSVMAQARAEFGVSTDTTLTSIHRVAENRYDVYTYQEEPMLIFKEGDRFAQVIFLPYSRPYLVESVLEDFTVDSRGGFGSSGR
jgi:dUTPase